MSLVSVIVPCYNEEAVIEVTLSRLLNLQKDSKSQLEFVFVNDGSGDKTLDLLLKANSQNPFVRVINLSRNFGHQLAVTSGLSAARGDACVVIDADLQDPPELILEMIKLWESGADVVFGVRKSRAGETFFKKVTAHFYYRIIARLSDFEIPKDSGDFRLMSRRVVNIFLAMPERDRYIRGMISWIGFNQVPLYYDRHERYAGETKYPLKKMLKFAADGIFSFSTKPLKVATVFGLVCAMVSFSALIYSLYIRIFTHSWVPGWTTIFAAVTLIGGIQLISIGILGEYIGRIYLQGKGRPHFLSEELTSKKESELQIGEELS